MKIVCERTNVNDAEKNPFFPPNNRMQIIAVERVAYVSLDQSFHKRIV